MELRKLGSTSLSVSKIGLGLAALGRPGYINLGHAADLDQRYDVAAMAQRAQTVLDAAYAGGVRYFDAARSYGRAEIFLGDWLRARAVPPGSLVVGSKWGYTYTANWQTDAKVHEIKEHSAVVLQRQWQESQENLGTYPDLYQIHSATLASGVLQNRAVLDALAQIKSEGVAIGLSVSGSRQAEVIRAAVKVNVDGARLFDSVQATWNLLERSAGAALLEAGDAGLAVIVKEGLANGRLTARNRMPAFARQLKRLQVQARRLHTSIDALALAAVLAQSWADVVLSGAATAAHVQSNLRALAVQWDDEADSETAALVESAEAYWNERSRLPWN